MLRYFLSISFVSHTLCLPISGTSGSVNLYTDISCTSLYAESVLDIDYCLGTNANTIHGVSIATLPTCSSGTPYLVITDALNCQQGSFSPPPTATALGQCLFLFDGLQIPSLAFGCASPESDGASTNCPVINITTPGTCTSSLATPSTYTILPTSISSSSPQASSTQPTASGFSRSDQIALGIGLGLGIPSLLVAMCQCMRRTVPT